MPDLPSFIIIGAMKAATSTLRQQLAHQPGIFMCEPKEPNFFSDDRGFEKGLGWYSGLFSGAADGDLLGEASTHYTKLPTYPQTVARLKRHLPSARFIYLMRHPIDRLVSHYIHDWSMGAFHCDIDDAVRRYPELMAYGNYAMQLRPYFQAFGNRTVLPVFFDRLIAEPQPELERICRFIGYRSGPEWSADLPPDNISAERIRRFPLHGVLIDSTLATWVRRSLVPRRVRNAVKRRRVMRQRPVLDATLRRQLEQDFDRDLEQLGKWLGAHITCSNFRQVTGSHSLDWVARDG